jgi:hypothetical protein
VDKMTTPIKTTQDNRVTNPPCCPHYETEEDENISSEEIFTNMYTCLEKCKIEYNESTKKMFCTIDHDNCPFNENTIFPNNATKIGVQDLISGFPDYVHMTKEHFMIVNAGPMMYQKIFWSKIYDLFTSK